MNAFRAAVEARDLNRIEDCLAVDVVFKSPIVHQPYTGRDSTMFVISAVMDVFEQFEYVTELSSEGKMALVFRARIGSKNVEGIDLCTVDQSGKITELTVFIRPRSGVEALRDAMAKKLGIISDAQQDTK